MGQKAKFFKIIATIAVLNALIFYPLAQGRFTVFADETTVDETAAPSSDIVTPPPSDENAGGGIIPSDQGLSENQTTTSEGTSEATSTPDQNQSTAVDQNNQVATSSDTNSTTTQEISTGDESQNGSDGADQSSQSQGGVGGDQNTPPESPAGGGGSSAGSGDQVTPPNENQGDGESANAEIVPPPLAGGSVSFSESSSSEQGSNQDLNNENRGEPENATSTDANNGDVGSTGNSGASSTITTGQATAVANVLNTVNVNIVDSNGWSQFLNFFGPLVGNIDFSNVSFPTIGSCPTGECGVNSGSQIVTSNNTSTIANNVNVGANSGENSIDGSGEINTGDSAAAANVVNLVNTNIIRSNYLLFSLNNFGSWGGDLVLPGKSFFDQIFEGLTKDLKANQQDSGGIVPCSNTDEFINNNSSTIESNINVGSETGSNTVSGSSTANIETGSASAISNVTNITNTNLYHQNSVYLLIRVMGNWNGNIFSTPPGITWEQTSEGILIHATDPGNEQNNPQNPQDSSSTEPDASSTVPSDSENNQNNEGEHHSPCSNISQTTNTNSADILNNVNVYALTGDNEITGNGSIRTGNAMAASNLFTMANTNIVGSNWLLGLVNVFGDWNGNVAFGRPDLWIGTRAQVSSNPLTSGGSITYTIDVANHGNADATKIKVRSGSSPFDKVDVVDAGSALRVSTLSAVSSAGGNENSDSDLVWDIPVLAPGQSATFTYTSKVADNLPSGDSTIETVSTVNSFETDAKSEDNTDTLALVVQGPIPAPLSGGAGGNVYVGGYGSGYGKPRLTMVKTSDATSTIEASTTVTYKLDIKNFGGDYAKNAYVEDNIKDPDGNVLETNSWKLGTIKTGDEVIVKYKVNFNKKAKPGAYLNEAVLTANDIFGGSVSAVIATSSVVVGGEVVGVNSVDTSKDKAVPGAGDHSGDLSSLLLKPKIALAAPIILPTFEKLKYKENGLASIFSVFPWMESNYFLLIVMVILLVLIVWRRTRKKDDGITGDNY